MVINILEDSIKTDFLYSYDEQNRLIEIKTITGEKDELDNEIIWIYEFYD